MFLTSLQRVIRSGINNFKRNGIVSLASVLVVTMALLVGLSLIFFQVVMRHTLTQVENKVDVTIYFATGAESTDVLEYKTALERLPEVASVTYVSSEEALARFRQEHAGDQLTLQALDELGSNPLGASLNVKAKETSQYEGIARFIENENALGTAGTGIIDKVNYEQNKTSIDRLTSIMDGTEALGLLITLVLIAISVIITFNTIRLTIYIAREEIGVMSLVGASRFYVRGPFIVEGVLSGAISALATMVIFFPISYWAGKSLTGFLGVNLYEYFTANFFGLFGLLFLAGIGIGAFSSFLAIRKYLRD